MKLHKAIAVLSITLATIMTCGAQDKFGGPTGLEYQLGDLHCIITQWDENPIWLATMKDNTHTSLSSITIPEDITIDGEGWLYLGERPAIIEKIGYESFYNSALRNIKIPSSVRRIGKSAFESASLVKVEFSKGLIFIGEKAFAHNAELESIELPQSLRFLDYACFSNCYSLKKIDLPSSLISLGGFTFRYCGSIEDIYCRAEIPPTADDTDFGIVHNTDYPQLEKPETPNFNNCVLHVPAGCEDMYRNASGWNNFKNIVEIDDKTDIEEIVSDADIPCYVANHTLTIPCKPNDIVSIYDASGVCLKKTIISTESEFKYSGNGIIIVSLNDKTSKIAL